MAAVQKIWYSTSANPPEFQGVKTRVRSRAAIPNFPSQTACTFTFEEETSTGLVPVMPYISVDGKPKLMEISFNTNSNTEIAHTEFNVDAFSGTESEEEETEPEPELDSWNRELVYATLESTKGQSLYRTIHTHTFKDEGSCGARGLFNTNNMCFYNSVLQVLVHCPQLNSLMNSIVFNTPLVSADVEADDYDVILSVIARFFYNYSTQGNVKRAMSSDELYNVICKQTKYFHVERGRQEDAQEFLTDLLDVIETCFKHAKPEPEDIADNLLAQKRAANQRSESPQATESDGDWVEIGQNSKVVETQHAGRQDLDNPLEDLFGGKLRSILVKKGGKPSITTEPFLQIPVDISNEEINTVQEAVDELLKVEILHLDEGQATKRIEFERLPSCLIVNLKRFTFIRQGDSFDFGKITKPVLVNEKLKFTQLGNKVVEYSPFGVIYHHGMDIYRGHYTADVKVNGQWFSIDDEQVVPVESDHVVGNGKNKGSQSAYMVLYSRID